VSPLYLGRRCTQRNWKNNITWGDAPSLMIRMVLQRTWQPALFAAAPEMRPLKWEFSYDESSNITDLLKAGLRS